MGNEWNHYANMCKSSPIETQAARKLRLETSLARAEHAARVLRSKLEASR